MASANSTEINKLSQKVKESLSRSIKNELSFCFVNLGELKYDMLDAVSIAATGFKSGKDSYMSAGKFICMVSYEEYDGETDKNRLNIALILERDLYSGSGAGKVGYGSILDNPPYGNPKHPASQINGLVYYLINGLTTSGNSSVRLNLPTPGQELFNYSYIAPQPFKEVDGVMKRFYDIMRERGFLVDEEEEDMGALADAAGLEW